MSLKENARYLRSHMTDAESKLWYQLRGHRFNGLKFRRQQPIGRYIVDFVCLQHFIIIEVVGGQHQQSRTDGQRDAWLQLQGFRVLRFWNNDVLLRTESVLESIYQALSATPARPLPHPLSRKRARGVSAVHSGEKPLAQTDALDNQNGKARAKPAAADKTLIEPAATSPRPLAGEGAGERVALHTTFID